MRRMSCEQVATEHSLSGVRSATHVAHTGRRLPCWPVCILSRAGGRVDLATLTQRAPASQLPLLLLLGGSEYHLIPVNLHRHFIYCTPLAHPASRELLTSVTFTLVRHAGSCEMWKKARRMDG